MFEIPILVTAVYICGLCLVVRALNAFIRHSLPRDVGSHLAEAVAAFFVCALSLEKSHVRFHYGTYGYVLICILGDTYTYFTYRNLSGNVCETLNQWLSRKLGSGQASIRAFLQITGGLAALQFARMIWVWGLTDFHYGRFTNFVSSSCTGDLNVSIATGFTIEFCAALFSIYVSRQQMKILGGFAVCFKSFLLTMMVLCGIDLTGMYYNPMNATNNNFGCQKISSLALFVVYWLAPALAYACASLTTRRGPVKPDGTKQANGYHDKVPLQNGHATRATTTNAYMNGEATKKKTKKRYYGNPDRMSSLRRR